jgi:polyisoprenoid-binding protein YceI
MSTTTTEVRRTLTGTWGLDPVHSSAGFEVPYLTGTFKGQFRGDPRGRGQGRQRRRQG